LEVLDPLEEEGFPMPKKSGSAEFEVDQPVTHPFEYT
jgi:hypothetical protein